MAGWTTETCKANGIDALVHLKDQLHELNISPPQLSSDHALYWDSFVRWAGDTVKALVARGDFREVSAVTNNLEETVASLMQNLYRVDDSVDGLEFIVSCAMGNTTKHQEIFKECYQISICYLNELKATFEDFLKFPIHLLMDVRLSEMMYRYSKEDFQSFLNFVEKYPTSNNVTNAGIASHWYKNLEKELNKIHRFIYEIKERLKELYVRQTNAHLLTQSVVLYKRHAVLSLFEVQSSPPKR